MFTIGEFSRMCGLPIKTLRFYHERGVLTPARVEQETGYRYYDTRNLETARVIVSLRRLDFSLDRIIAILEGHDDDADILDFLTHQKQKIAARIERHEEIVRVLDAILAQEKEAREAMREGTTGVQQKELSPQLVGGVRMRGKYLDSGPAFGRLGHKLGRHIAGKALMLCYDTEYKEDGADFEVCMPVRKPLELDEVDVREIPGGRFLTLVHEGPYEELSRSYGKLLEFASREGIALAAPSREVYLKGPGMIFKGNPKRYRTEIQFPIAAGFRAES